MDAPLFPPGTMGRYELPPPPHTHIHTHAHTTHTLVFASVLSLKALVTIAIRRYVGVSSRNESLGALMGKCWMIWTVHT